MVFSSSLTLLNTILSGDDDETFSMISFILTNHARNVKMFGDAPTFFETI